MEEEESKKTLQKEEYTGQLCGDGFDLPLTFQAWADKHGQLHVEPATVQNAVSALPVLQQMGKVGEIVHTMRLTGSSASGKSFHSETTNLSGFNHTDGVSLKLDVPDATISWESEVVEAPFLRHHLLGFESYSEIRAQHPLGTVHVFGPMRAKGEDLSGVLEVRAKDANVDVAKWRNDTRVLLDHVSLLLGFARGGRLPVPVRCFRSGTAVELTFIKSRSVSVALPPFHSLNLSAFVKTAVASDLTIGKLRDDLALAVGWLSVSTSYNELRLFAGVTAIESLIERQLGDSKKIMKEGVFKKFRKGLSEAVKTSPVIKPAQADAVIERFPELNRTSLKFKIRLLLDQWGIGDAASDETIAQIIKKRNAIVHAGGPEADADLWDEILVVRDIVTRFILAMIGYVGPYRCFVGGEHVYEISKPTGTEEGQ